MSPSASNITSVPLASKVPFISKVEPDNISNLFAVNLKSSAPEILISIVSSVSAAILVSPSASKTNSEPSKSVAAIFEELVANILIMSFADAAADNTTAVPLVAV